MADVKTGTHNGALSNHGLAADEDLDSALLFGAHHLATKSAERAAQQCGHLSQALQQCRTQIDTCADQAKRIEVRLGDTRTAAAQLAEALDRIKLVALNTGLEGARLGESAGKAVAAVADEVRTLASRGLDIVASHLRQMQDAEAEQQRLVQAAELAQSQAVQLASQLRQAHESQCDTLAALGELEKNIERISGLDANSAADLQRVAEHGQELVAALESLSAARRQRVVRSLLLPTIEPLLKTLLTEAQLDSRDVRDEPEP